MTTSFSMHHTVRNNFRSVNSPDLKMKKSHKKRKQSEKVIRLETPSSSSSSRNPLYKEQKTFLNSLDKNEIHNFFSPTFSAEKRGELWMEQATLGEELVNKYSWATPDDRCIRILQHYSPIVEIGCGANAYWSQCMASAGIDVEAYDVNPHSGGTIGNVKKTKKKKRSNAAQSSFKVQSGGPKVLQQKGNRTLFLCYPDEDGEVTVGDSEEPMSMGSACLEYYTGDIVIHVGELYSDTLSVDQAPWGRSSGPDFQVRLASEFHCILKASLSNWLHVRDSISVWKRTQTCPIVFASDSDGEEEDEEVEYRYIPESERLPTDIAAPCLAHLLNDKHETNGWSDESLKKLATNATGDTSNTLEANKSENKKKRDRSKQEGNKDAKDEYECPW